MKGFEMRISVWVPEDDFRESVFGKLAQDE